VHRAINLTKKLKSDCLGNKISDFFDFLVEKDIPEIEAFKKEVEEFTAKLPPIY